MSQPEKSVDNNEASLTTPVTDSSHLTTTVGNDYGTIESNERVSSQNGTVHSGTSSIGSPLLETPKPAVRKKVKSLEMSQESEMSQVAPISEKMQVIDDTIQVIGQQNSNFNRISDKTDAFVTSCQIKVDNLPTFKKIDEDSISQHDYEQQQSLHEPNRPYPKKVLFIIANEFCERFSYYGLRTVLVLYFRSVLGFSDSGSTVSFHLFATLCYLTPILGAILGDSILGKYKTILYLSGVYFLGELILVISSVFWDLNTLSIFITWLGLFLIGIGTGGIKPCVAAFAGDQFLPNESKWRESFFSLFYGAINLGSLLSMFLTPLLRSNYNCVGRNDCYPYAFGLPCLLIFIATVIFLLAHNYYYVSPLPDENIILAFCRCIWLALKRKMRGQKPRVSTNNNFNASLADSSPASSRLSITSSENESKPVASSSRNQLVLISSDKINGQLETNEQSSKRSNHWLYLASDQFSRHSIEEFRSVLGLLLLFLPTPVYWCLFDQQGSLWTLQASRMDGRVLNTNLVLEPDQMMVANPLLLLCAIPVFQFVIYPTLNRCNIITTPIQRMTTGGFIAALSFVVSALIEFQLQASQPHQVPLANRANLLIVNGLDDCSIASATIYLTQPQPTISQFISVINANQTNNLNSISDKQQDNLFKFNTIELLNPLSTQSVSEIPTSNATQPFSYKLSFRVENHPQLNHTNSQLSSLLSSSTHVGCAFDLKQDNELNIGPLPSQSARMLYIEQGNGKLTHKLFNDSLTLPKAGKARVRLLYEFFGSFANAQKRTFYLTPVNMNLKQQRSLTAIQFDMIARDGQVLLSDYLDIDVAPSGSQFWITSNDSSLQIQQTQPLGLMLEPGTRNLLIMHQIDASKVKLKQELLQDNNYRVSVFYQLIPYVMISMSEVMFSITGLEFSYSMAPPNLKSLILGAWSLTTALGNILTVAVESFHPFSNIGHDFLFYAALMAADMVLFAILGYYYEPYQSNVSKTESKPKSKDQKQA